MRRSVLGGVVFIAGRGIGVIAVQRGGGERTATQRGSLGLILTFERGGGCVVQEKIVCRQSLTWGNLESFLLIMLRKEEELTNSDDGGNFSEFFFWGREG